MTTTRIQTRLRLKSGGVYDVDLSPGPDATLESVSNAAREMIHRFTHLSFETTDGRWIAVACENIAVIEVGRRLGTAL